jgi:hypothetical protein
MCARNLCQEFVGTLKPTEAAKLDSVYAGCPLSVA